ncbi:Golgi apparatus membrane protein TVP23 [Frankliniella fusca]|uniref:Golgi apparatus membrane protein TVP23 n=1 Tax=Frankliniella fusca TaxID=407009 RepID=A0AAE1HV71_9NEOP|nr:Golgi apparatus membrane protein TVP23 [Frankliniella fusca]
MSRVHVFVIVLEDRSYKEMGPLSTRERNFESGDPVLYYGKEAVILGSGATRKEARESGTTYYNEVCRIHGEEDNWIFNTQDPVEEHVQCTDNQDNCYGPASKRRKL